MGYHHVNHFDGDHRKDAYDDFFARALQVIAINVLSCAVHAQALLVEYIRNDLSQPKAAE